MSSSPGIYRCGRIRQAPGVRPHRWLAVSRRQCWEFGRQRRDQLGIERVVKWHLRLLLLLPIACATADRNHLGTGFPHRARCSGWCAPCGEGGALTTTSHQKCSAGHHGHGVGPLRCGMLGEKRVARQREHMRTNSPNFPPVLLGNHVCSRSNSGGRGRGPSKKPETRGVSGGRCRD